MIKKRRFPKIFAGWWIVITSGIIALWTAGYHAYGFSALFKPIASELGFSRAIASVPAAIGRLEGGFEGPLAGWATDRFGPRWIILFGVFLFGLSLLLMNYINSLWAFYIVWGVMLGTGHNVSASVPIDTAITNWFVRKRGVALGTKMVFSGLSGVLVLPLIAWLISTQGWRMTCLIGGAVTWFVCLPLTWFFIKQHRPEYYGLLPDGAAVGEEAADTHQMIDRGIKYAAEVQEVEFTLRQAMKRPTYWLLITAHAVHSLVSGAINVHLIPLLTDIGIDPIKAAGMMAIMVFSSIPSRFVGGFLADRMRVDHMRFLMGVAYLLQAVGFAVYLQNQTISAIYAWFIIYGIGMGAGFMVSAMTARYFGRKAYGSIRGSMSMFWAPVGVVAPIYAGWVYDTSGSYWAALVLSAVALAAAGVLMFLAIPPKPPAQITDIRKIL